MTGADITMDPPPLPGGESIDSMNSLKNLGTRVVKGLGASGATVASSTQLAARQLEGVVPKIGGANGSGGSILGELLASYSTSTLPPSKRHSISVTAAHFEELAAEAGVDLDVDDINMEDLRVHRLDDGSAYQLDDDSDEDIDYKISNETSATNQKLAHKERSIMQMVDVLSDRLASLNSVVINRYNGCKSDLDEATDFRSSRTKPMEAAALEEEWDSGAQAKGMDRGKRVTGGYLAAEGGDGNHVVELARIAFRNAPQTDAGKRLAHQFEQEYGLKQV